MKFFLKPISLLLALCLTISMILVPVSAEGGGEVEIDDFSQTEGAHPVGSDTEEDEDEPEETEESIYEFGRRKYPDIQLNIPLYLQTDYANVRYGSGTVATSGCAMACVAMLASYFNNTELKPDELAIRFRDYEASNVQRMEAASIVEGLKFHVVFSWYDVIDALCNGKPVVILVGRKSAFTRSQHLMVLSGISSDGKITVLDPYGPNYKKSALKEGFREGFDEDDVAAGFSGAWIFEKYIPPEDVEPRYPDIQLTDEERDLLAKIIWLEARGESFEGQCAVAEVVFNRMVSPIFPTNTLTGTIMAKGQFRTSGLIDTANPGELQYAAIDRALSGPYQLPENAFFFARYATNNNVIARIGKHTFCGPNP